MAEESWQLTGLDKVQTGQLTYPDRVVRGSWPAYSKKTGHLTYLDKVKTEQLTYLNRVARGS